MKKLFVLSLVALMVMGMSLVSFAEVMDGDSTTVNLDIDKLATVEMPESLSLEILDFEKDHENNRQVADESEEGTVTIKTNCDVTVTFESDWSDMAEELGITEDELVWSGSDDSNYLISPNMNLWYDNLDSMSVEDGAHQEEINRIYSPSEIILNIADNGVYEFGMTTDININKDATWYNIPADSYEGTIVATVAASVN